MKKDEKYEKALLVRLTAKEHEELLKKAAESKVAAAEYVRMLLKNQKPPDAALIRAIDRVVYEINKIGVNVNQIAYKLNSTDVYEKSEVEAVKADLEKLLEGVINGYIEAAAHKGEEDRKQGTGA